MREFTIYCTKAQTKKALELGAPIKECPSISSIREKKFYLKEVKDWFFIPTAEEMIGWLESKSQIHHISVWRECVRWLYTFYYVQDGFVKRFDIGSSGNRKEATLAAIDAAMEYLENLKQYSYDRQRIDNRLVSNHTR